jgi:hypothetical protein
LSCDDWETAKIPPQYEEWNRSILGQKKQTYTGKELVKVLEKLISKKSKETT